MSATRTPPPPAEAPRTAEALDQTVATTTTRGWIALALVAALVAAAVVWSLVATLPRELTATGVLADPDAAVAIAAGAPGTVQLHVQAGAEVRAGERLATVTPFDGSAPREIASPAAGHVGDVAAIGGEGVEPADTLMLVLREHEAHAGRVVTFVSQEDAARYRPGLESVAIPQADAREEGLAARVTRVAAVPSGLAAITAAVHDEAIAQRLLRDADGAAFRVELELQAPPGAALPPEGSVVSLRTRYDEAHPIDYLLGNPD